MKFKELQEKNVTELIALLHNELRALVGLRFKLPMGELENKSLMKKTKRAIARIKTLIHQRRGQ